VLVRLARSGVAIDVILARGKSYPEQVDNLHVTRFPITRGLRWYIAPFIVPAAIRAVYDRSPFDILRVHSLRYIGPSALLARRRYRLEVPIISHHHHLDSDPLNGLIEKRVVEASERVVTVSEFSKRQLVEDLDVRVEHVTVIHNGVDEAFSPGLRDAGLAERLGLGSEPVGMFLGGLKRRKNLRFLLEVWRDVVARLKGATLLVCGSGEEESRLKQAAKDIGIQRQVIFAGHISESEKVRFYRLAQVFISVSSLEGFGLSVAEAMSCGLPVVVARQGALPELVGSSPGARVCQPGSRSEFAEAILGFASAEEVRRQGGEANRQRVNAYFRWPRAIDAMKAAYAETLARWSADRARVATRTSL